MARGRKTMNMLNKSMEDITGKTKQNKTKWKKKKHLLYQVVY